MKTEHALAIVYYLVNVGLYASYIILWKTKDVTGTVFFTKDGFQKLNVKVLCLKKQFWVLLFASLAFAINVAFVNAVSFDLNAWDSKHLEALHATLYLQIFYFFLQIFYIPMLLSKTKEMLFWTQFLLGTCALLQVISAILAGVYGKGYAKYLNIYPAVWTTCFDFLTYSLPKPRYKIFNWLQKYTISLYDYAQNKPQILL